MPFKDIEDDLSTILYFYNVL